MESLHPNPPNVLCQSIQQLKEGRSNAFFDETALLVISSILQDNLSFKVLLIVPSMDYSNWIQTVLMILTFNKRNSPK
jgi:hypothetical protein